MQNFVLTEKILLLKSQDIQQKLLKTIVLIGSLKETLQSPLCYCTNLRLHIEIGVLIQCMIHYLNPLISLSLSISMTTIMVD